MALPLGPDEPKALADAIAIVERARRERAVQLRDRLAAMERAGESMRLTDKWLRELVAYDATMVDVVQLLKQLKPPPSTGSVRPVGGRKRVSRV